MRRAECKGLIITLVFATICDTLIALGMLYGYKENKNKVFIVFIAPIIDIQYMVMYILVIIELNRAMAKMDGDLRNEKRSVNYQFSIFLLA